jgi:predicted RNase H-like HicB family nuclease
MKKSETFSLELSKHNNKATANLLVYEFEDNGFFVSYNQSLELSSYGKTKEEAKRRFIKEVFPDFCKHLIELPEDKIYMEFKRLGWTQDPFFKKELSNSVCVDKEGILKNFNLPEGSEIEEQYLTV